MGRRQGWREGWRSREGGDGTGEVADAEKVAVTMAMGRVATEIVEVRLVEGRGAGS